jgi:hypothetical protein
MPVARQSLSHTRLWRVLFARGVHAAVILSLALTGYSGPASANPAARPLQQTAPPPGGTPTAQATASETPSATGTLTATVTLSATTTA